MKISSKLIQNPDEIMTFATLLKYCSFGLIVFVSSTAIHHRCSTWHRKFSDDDDEDKEINEIVYTRSSINKNTKLTRNIDFVREPEFHALEIISNLILSAKESVYVAVYIFSSEDLARALTVAKKRGIDVKVVLDASMEIASSSTLQLLRSCGIPVKIHDAKMMHLKLCVIDVPFGRRKMKVQHFFDAPISIPSNGITVTGSMNWTREGLLRNEENFIVSSNANLCHESAKQFQEVWKSSQPSTLKQSH